MSKMSYGYAKLELTKGNKMNKLKKLEEALNLLKEQEGFNAAYPMMYGYLAVLVSEKQADEVLLWAKTRGNK